MSAVRIEKDLLGTREVPADAYYGIQTLRAHENFQVTKIPLSHYPKFVQSMAMVKKAAARANMGTGELERPVGLHIERACDDIIAGRLHEHFIVDMIQGGAGTSTNMNANEVIANRALELMGYAKGDYRHVHPNNHVNMSQSTNDAYPAMIKVAISLSHGDLAQSMEQLIAALREKGTEFGGVLKMGRTQLQDAVPMTLGQEFNAFANTLNEDIQRLREVSSLFRELNLGGTAIGTGLNASAGYTEAVINELSAIAGIDFVSADDLIESTSDTGAFVIFSGVLKRIAVKLSKMCNDLRLLSSGPRTGLGEINLPPMQPGSSIMPGKVNPVIPELVNQVAFQVIGNDLTVTLAAEGGQLQLNVFEPVIIFKILQSMEMLASAMDTLRERCIVGISANEDRCRDLVEHSIGLITALVPRLGYEDSTRIASQALRQGCGVRELVLAEGLLTEAELATLLDPMRMTQARPAN
ncbi:MAG TPA: aspartate ammonia-lyase [Thiolinea sp.]|nr:aspartate ammonia-lyase [Thiolinea sp.]